MAELVLSGGLSGCEVILDTETNRVTKTGPSEVISRNVNSHLMLQSVPIACHFLPILHDYQYTKLGTPSYMVMEYIHGYDMANALLYVKTNHITSFLNHAIWSFINQGPGRPGTIKQYADTILTATMPVLSRVDGEVFGDLSLPWKNHVESNSSKLNFMQSPYHGDFTLDNMLYSTHRKKFYLIDGLTTAYDSYAFDLAKLRLDLEGRWFLRNRPEFNTPTIRNRLFMLHQFMHKMFTHYSNNISYIAMMLRVYPYTKEKSNERKLLNHELFRMMREEGLIQ